MPRTALRPSPNLARVLKQRREELGLSMYQVTKQVAKLGEPIPFPTLRKIELGEQEVGVRRLYALCRLYELPIELVPDLMELDQLAATLPPPASVEKLYAKGRELWEKGDLGPALAHLFALRLAALEPGVSRPDRQKALLAFAIAASGVGRTKLSHRVIEQILIEGPEPEHLFGVLIQAAVTWQRLGSAIVAAAFLGAAAQAADPKNARQNGLLRHQQGRFALAQGQFDEAGEHFQAAIAFYKRAKESLNLLLVRRLEFERLLASGQTKRALEAATSLRTDALRAESAQIACYATIDEGRALLTLKRAEPARNKLEDALSQALDLRDRAAEFFTHFWLWKTCLALGDVERARIERDLALYYLHHVDEVTEETKELKALAGGDHGSAGEKRKLRAVRR